MESSPKYPVDLVRVMLVREARGKYRSRNVSSPQEAWEVVRERLGAGAAERLVVLLLDARNRVVRIAEVSSGTLTACIVHPREVFAPAILSNAASIIVAHNHPSGDTTPSDADLDLRDRLEEAGEILGVPVADFLIVTDEGFRSLKT
jgi:DNA repair protein RadC